MKIYRLAFAALFAVAQIEAPVSVVFAQNPGPEVNEDFQNDVKESGENAGGPIEDSASARSEFALPKAGPPGKLSGRNIGSQTPLYETAESKSPLNIKIQVLKVKGAPISAFLDIISAQTQGKGNINFIVSESVVDKKITAYLRDVTVKDALQYLLEIKGLTYRRIGKSNTYLVTARSYAGPNLVTKIYTLNYVSLSPMSDDGDKESSSFLAQDVSAGSGTGGSQSSGGGGSKDKADSGIAILGVIKSVQSKHGKIAVEPRTNSLVVTDIPEVFPAVEQILLELDRKAPQVLIEAQIVEINTDRVNELGIEWGGSRGELAYFVGPARLTDYGLRPGLFSGDNWQYFFPSGSNFTVTNTQAAASSGASATGTGSTGGGTATSGNSSNLTGGDSGSGGSKIDPIFATGQMGKNGLYYGIFSLAQLQAILRALISKSEARYLGKPKIVTLNNKMAQIQISREAAVGVANVVASAGGSAGTSTNSVERKRIGLMLKVTPQVNKEGYITLFVQPSYSDITASGVTMSGSSVYDPVSRGASTLVRVKNGQTVVLGGMLSSNEQKLVKKVPLLGYIPILGWLFTSTSTRRINTDLVIFITPTILMD